MKANRLSESDADDPLLPQAVRMLADKKHPGLQPSPRGKAILAFCASALCPGLGHIFAGYYERAVIFFLLTTGVLAAFLTTLLVPRYVTALPMFVPVIVMIEFYQLLDAASCGKLSTKKMLGDRHLRYAAAVAFLVAAYIGQDVGMAYLQNDYVQITNYPLTNMVPAIQLTDHFVCRDHVPFTRWDIVMVSSPDPRYDVLAERVVGLPGEKIEITGNQLLIDDIPIPLPDGVDRYLPINSNHEILESPSPTTAANGCWGKPITLGPDEYYLLGDNPPVSSDSRSWMSVEGHQPGALPRDQVIGRVVAIVWPSVRGRYFPSPAD